VCSAGSCERVFLTLEFLFVCAPLLQKAPQVILKQPVGLDMPNTIAWGAVYSVRSLMRRLRVTPRDAFARDARDGQH
jgi:hypothetical protein